MLRCSVDRTGERRALGSQVSGKLATKRATKLPESAGWRDTIETAVKVGGKIRSLALFSLSFSSDGVE